MPLCQDCVKILTTVPVIHYIFSQFEYMLWQLQLLCSVLVAEFRLKEKWRGQHVGRKVIT